MIDFAVYSNPGAREVNEDYISFFADDDRFCFVIADGLGGEGSGDMASRFVCNHTISIAEKADSFSTTFLEQCFTRIQKNLLRAKEELFITQGMTSTLSILAIEGNKASWGHIGDTRIYCFDSERLVSVTPDHSLAQFMMDAGMSDVVDARQHPDRSTLMAAMGMLTDNDAHEIDATDVTLDAPYSFLMCTDGFWQYVMEEDMFSVITSVPTAEAALSRMVKIAEKRAEGEDRDNISAILVRYIPDNH
ncbi:MAG: serine/threonine-protein phosphatase [Clostridia bacterium]|nr:serine/threonine-protein phosphatase [Clostridia bacterium]